MVSSFKFQITQVIWTMLWTIKITILYMTWQCMTVYWLNCRYTCDNTWQCKQNKTVFIYTVQIKQYATMCSNTWQYYTIHHNIKWQFCYLYCYVLSCIINNIVSQCKCGNEMIAEEMKMANLTLSGQLHVFTHIYMSRDLMQHITLNYMQLHDF